MSFSSPSPPSSPSLISSPTDSFTTSLWSPRSSETSLTDNETSSRSSSVQAAPSRAPKLTEYVCTLCGEIQTKRNKARHLKLQHKDHAPSGSPEPNAEFHCPHCSKTFTRDDSCTRHIKNGVCKAPQAVIKQREAIKAQKKESKPPGRRASRKQKRKTIKKEIQQLAIPTVEGKPSAPPAATPSTEECATSFEESLLIFGRLWEEGVPANVTEQDSLDLLSLEPSGTPLDSSIFDFDAYEFGCSSADSPSIEDSPMSALADDFQWSDPQIAPLMQLPDVGPSTQPCMEAPVFEVMDLADVAAWVASLPGPSFSHDGIDDISFQPVIEDKIGSA